MRTKTHYGMDCDYPYCNNRPSCLCSYTAGIEPPNYPVPAITLNASIWAQWLRTSWINPDSYVD